MLLLFSLVPVNIKKLYTDCTKVKIIIFYLSCSNVSYGHSSVFLQSILYLILSFQWHKYDFICILILYCQTTMISTDFLAINKRSSSLRPSQVGYLFPCSPRINGLVPQNCLCSPVPLIFRPLFSWKNCPCSPVPQNPWEGLSTGELWSLVKCSHVFGKNTCIQFLKDFYQ